MLVHPRHIHNKLEPFAKMVTLLSKTDPARFFSLSILMFFPSILVLTFLIIDVMNHTLLGYIMSFDLLVTGS